MKEQEVQDVAAVCKMLSDETRTSIVALVAKKARPVGELCRELDLPQPTVSHHLGLLRMSGVLSRQRKGKQMFYSLNRDKLTALKRFLTKVK